MSLHYDEMEGVDMTGALMPKADVRVWDEGSIFILTALSAAGEDWMAEHLGESDVRWGNGVVVEHRYVAAILRDMVRDGLAIN